MMADYDSNMIKPVEGLQSISGLKPAKRRRERKRRQHFDQESEQKDEQIKSESDQQRDMDDTSHRWNENTDNMNPESNRIDYCA
jgi:hypothetical protein